MYDASNQTLSPAQLASTNVTPVYSYGMRNTGATGTSTDGKHSLVGSSSLDTFNLVADSTAKLEI